METEVQLLDELRIDEGREFIEFRFSDTGGNGRAAHIDFGYCESLAAVFQQAFVSAILEERRGGNQAFGHGCMPVPRADVDHPSVSASMPRAAAWSPCSCSERRSRSATRSRIRLRTFCRAT